MLVIIKIHLSYNDLIFIEKTMYKNWITCFNAIRFCFICTEWTEAILRSIFFNIFVFFFFMFQICPVGNPIFLVYIWILHTILGRIAPVLNGFKKFYLKSKYPNQKCPLFQSCLILLIKVQFQLQLFIDVLKKSDWAASGWYSFKINCCVISQ